MVRRFQRLRQRSAAALRETPVLEKLGALAFLNPRKARTLFATAWTS